MRPEHLCVFSSRTWGTIRRGDLLRVARKRPSAARKGRCTGRGREESKCPEHPLSERREKKEGLTGRCGKEDGGGQLQR